METAGVEPASVKPNPLRLQACCRNFILLHLHCLASAQAQCRLTSSLQASVGKTLNLLPFPIPLYEALSIPRERMERLAFFLGKAAFAARRRRHMRSRCRLLFLPLDKGASGAPACKSRNQSPRRNHFVPKFAYSPLSLKKGNMDAKSCWLNHCTKSRTLVISFTAASRSAPYRSG